MATGTDIFTNQAIAVKREKKAACNPDARQSPLEREFRIYQLLRGVRGLPQIYWIQETVLYRLLAMELMGPSLEDLRNAQRGRLAPLQACRLIESVLEPIEHLHRKSLLHCDIKPQNIVIGHDKGRERAVLIDFGLARYYRHPQTQTPLPFHPTYQLVGTPRFTSIRGHYGTPCSRRDDLESLGYVLVYLCRGQLPWPKDRLDGQLDLDAILMAKLRCSPYDLCRGLPTAILRFWEHVEGLEQEDAPNYCWLRRTLRDISEPCDVDSKSLSTK